MPSIFPDIAPEWHETSPGTFVRGWDPQEKAVKVSESSGIHDMVAFKVKLRVAGCDLVASTYQAWVALRHRHPKIAAEQDTERSCYVYKTPDNQELQQWVAATLQVREDLDGEAYLDQVRHDPRPVLLVFPKTSELVLQAPHIYLDGPGGLRLLASIVADLENPPAVSFGKESDNLDVAMTTCIGMKEITPGDDAYCKKLLQIVADGQPSMGVPYREAPVPAKDDNPLKGKRTSHTFTPSQTRNIIKACKAAGWTPTHALHTAIMLATQAQSTDQNEKFSNVNIINYTDRSLPIYASRSQGLGSSLLVTAFPFTVVPGDKSFPEVCQEVKGLYRSHRSNDDFPGAHAPFCLARASAELPKDAPPPSSPVLSSWGVLEKLLPRKIGNIEVVNFSFAIIQARSAAPGCFLWTFNERMTITACWKEVYKNKGEMDEFMGLIVKEMTEGLGVRC